MNRALRFLDIIAPRVGRRKLTLYSLAGVVAALVLLGAGFFFAEIHSPRVQGTGNCAVYRTCFDCVADDHCGYCPGIELGQCLEGNGSSAVNGTCKTSDWAFSQCPNASKVSGWFILVALFLYLAAFASVSLFVGPRDWL